MIRKTLTKSLLLLGVFFLSHTTAWGDTTYKLTQVTSVAAGNQYVFVESGNALTASVKSNALQSTTTYSTTGLTGSENYIWTLETATGGFYIKKSNYLDNASGTDMSLGSKTKNTAIWQFTFSDDVALITNTKNSNRFIGNASGTEYRAYVNDEIGLSGYPHHDFTVYLVEEETTPTVYTVTYHVGDNNYNVERTNGTTLSLDEPAAIGGMDFAGWSSSNDVASPVWVANSATVTSDMELWALFTISAPTEGYYLVEEALDDWRGDYLIAYSSTLFADGRKGGTDAGGICVENINVNPSEHLSGKVVDAAWGDTYNVSFLAKNDANLSLGYVLKTKDNNYTYCNSGSISSTNNKSTANSHPMTITFSSSSDIRLVFGDYSLQYNSTNNVFRFYSTTYEPVYLYKKQGVPGVYSLGKSKSLNITAAKFAPYCSDEGLDFSGTGAKAYKAKVVGSAVKLTEIDGGVVPANTGIIVYKDVDATEAISVPVTLTAATVTDNELVGVTAETVVPWQTDDRYNYILQKDTEDGKAKFFKATGKKIMPNRAYLSTKYNVAEGRGLELVFEGEEDGNVTGIVSVGKPQTTLSREYYNLSGQRIALPTNAYYTSNFRLKKGVYVVNGQMFIAK